MSRQQIRDEIIQALTAENTWVTRMALLNQCATPKDGDALSMPLLALIKAGTIQKRSGPCGLEFALVSVTDENLSPREARGPNGVAEQLAPAAAPGSTPQTLPTVARSRPAHVQQMAAGHAPKKGEAIKQEILAALATSMPLTNRELREKVGLPQTTLSKYLRKMAAEKLIEVAGGGSLTRGGNPKFQLKQSPAGSAPETRETATPKPPAPVEESPEPADKPPPPAAPETATETESEATQEPEAWRVMRPKVLALFDERPEWTNQELAERLGKHTNTVLIYLRALIEEGLIQRKGGRADCFYVRVASAPISVRPLSNSIETRFCYWSDGRLEIHACGQSLVLSQRDTTDLMDYVERVPLRWRA